MYNEPILRNTVLFQIGSKLGNISIWIPWLCDVSYDLRRGTPLHKLCLAITPRPQSVRYFTRSINSTNGHFLD